MINGISNLSYAYEGYAGAAQAAPEDGTVRQIIRNPGESTEKQAGRESSQIGRAHV